MGAEGERGASASALDDDVTYRILGWPGDAMGKADHCGGIWLLSHSFSSVVPRAWGDSDANRIGSGCGGSAEQPVGKGCSARELCIQTLELSRTLASGVACQGFQGERETSSASTLRCTLFKNVRHQNLGMS